jgi:hypothetical protein
MTSDCNINNLTFPDVGWLGFQDLTQGATSLHLRDDYLPFQELHTHVYAYYSFESQNLQFPENTSAD